MVMTALGGRAAVAALVLLAAPCALGRTVTDLAGRTVEIPDRSRRVACLEAMCYARMLMLNAGDRVVSRVANFPPWAARTNSGLADIPTFVSTPNLEDILARNPDLAMISANYGLPAATLAAAGIPALVAQPLRPARSAEEFISDAKAMMRLGGQALGPQAEEIAEAWCGYLDDWLRLIRERVAAVPAERRPRLYYVRGPKAWNTHGKGGFFNWIGILAGARMVIEEDGSPAANVEISPETLIRWDPEVIVVGRQYPPEIVLDDPRLATVSAVRQGRVWPSPEGVFFWDGGPEQVLLLQYLAKRLHPDLFADLDLAAEVKGYYARFYRTRLSDADVDNLLRGRDPDGRRVPR